MRRPAVLVLTLALAACRGGGSTSPDAPSGDDVDADVTPDHDGSEPDGAPPDGPIDPPEGLVQCEVDLPTAGEGTCDVVDGAADVVVVRGDVLGDGVTYLDGEVMYDGERIVCAGCDCSDQEGYATATQITCGGAAVSPGLINAHNHITFDNRFPLGSTEEGGTRYINRREWRVAVSTPGNQHGTGFESDGMRWNELRHLLAGTTAVVGSGRANGLIRNLDEPEGLDYDHGLARIEYEVFILQDRTRTEAPDNCAWNYKYEDFAVAFMPGLVTHTAEGIDAYSAEEFRCQATSLDGGHDYVERNVGHVHAIALDAADYWNMARDGAALVWSPRSNISLYGNTSQAQVMDRVGGVVALGTDWTYSGSATMPREMSCAAAFDDAYLGDAFTDEEIWRMATINAAIATRSDHAIGSIAVGKIADLAVFRADGATLHRAVIDATSDDVVLVVRGGEVLYGETDVVASFAACEAVDICGAGRSICAAGEFEGRTFAEIEATVLDPDDPEDPDDPAPAYPAEICAAPPQEPTCLPSRPGEYDGTTGEDPDGDGVTAGDNCPDVFNPVRPIDGEVQADVDGDGAGDACDETPLGDDLDGDSHGNTEDLCPFVDDDQADADEDGKGDVCDACDDQPNPETVCFPPSNPIVEIQDGTLAEGTDVFVNGAVVTAVLYNGFTMQDPAVASGEHAGVFVFTFDEPALDVGDTVAVSGSIDEFFGLTEIVDAAFVKTGETTPIAPVAVDVADATDERWEGVLVTLTGITTIEAYDCSVDDGNCQDDLLHEVDDAVVIWNAAWEGDDAAWSAEMAGLAAGEPVTGVMTFRFERTRITPRVGADVGN